MAERQATLICDIMMAWMSNHEETQLGYCMIICKWHTQDNGCIRYFHHCFGLVDLT